MKRRKAAITCYTFYKSSNSNFTIHFYSFNTVLDPITPIFSAIFRNSVPVDE